MAHIAWRIKQKSGGTEHFNGKLRGKGDKEIVGPGTEKGSCFSELISVIRTQANTKTGCKHECTVERYDSG